MLIHSSLANETGALNSSQAGNITLGNTTSGKNSSFEAQNVTVASNTSENIILANNTRGQNSSVEAQNITLANNASENVTLANNTTGQNSSVEAQDVTMANNTGNIAVKATMMKCFETKSRPVKAYVKEFIIEYSDNGNLWRQYHEGGYLKVFVLTRNSLVLHNHLVFTPFMRSLARRTAKKEKQKTNSNRSGVLPYVRHICTCTRNRVWFFISHYLNRVSFLLLFGIVIPL